MLKISVYIIVLLSFFSLVSAYPQLDYFESSYDPGPVNISAEASIGTQVELLVNGDVVGRADLIHENSVISLTGSIQDIEVPIGSQFTFRNDNPGVIYRINISDGPYSVLEFGDTVSHSLSEPGDVLYRDENEGITQVISAIDSLDTVTFSDAENYMVDGENQITFIQRYPLTTRANEQEYNFNVEYDKYSNDITVTEYTEVTNDRTIYVQGRVDDLSSPLHYVLNANGPITNAGLLIPVELDGNNFNFSISSNVIEGENEIRLISTDPDNSNLFNGETRIVSLVDTLDPTIEMTESIRVYTDESNLELNITTDASNLTYQFNDNIYTAEIDNQTSIIELDLVEGQNNLTLTAMDLAGNVYKEAHTIFFDDNEPEIADDSLKPEEVFSGEARFQFQKIEGRTTKPNVDMVIFTLPEGAQDSDGNRVSCNEYENYFVRNLGQLDNDRVDGPENNPEEFQVSLLGLIHKKVELTTDDNGNFDAVIGLQEASFDTRDTREFERDENPDVGSSRSTNTICFVMKDRFGNFNIEQERITLDVGNVLWVPGEVTTVPNTMYAAEIEQTGDRRANSDRPQFGMIATFQYVGGGEISYVNEPRVRADRQGAEDARYANPLSNRANYRFDKQTGELIVFVPVEIRPLGVEPTDYPDELDLSFQMDMSYRLSDDDRGVPVDLRNPVYFQTSINIERPLDHTKWLSPGTIDDMLGFLNKSIDFTESITDFTGQLTVGGVLACTGAKFMYGLQIAQINALPDTDDAEKQEKKDKAMRDLLMVCDRVACTSSPQMCQTGDFETDENIFRPQGDQRTYSEAELRNRDGTSILNSQIDSQVLAEYDDLRLGGHCIYGRNPDGSPIHGVLVDGTVTEYEHEPTSGTWVSRVPAESEMRVVDECVRAQYDINDNDPETPDQIIFDEESERWTFNEEYEGAELPQEVDLASRTGMCYTEGAPAFDDTRCLGQAGKNPADNIIESLQCGCITDTYSHLKKLLRVQQEIEACLQSAKIGEASGSYCERLLSQAVCDLASNYVFKTLADDTGRQNADGEDKHENVLTRSLQGLNEGNRALNDRYRDTIVRQGGLSTYQVVNKACTAAISGDFSILTENILTQIEQNEVEPIFGPAFPESRLQGYNPLTGELSVMYRFTYAAISGGQFIRSDVKFACDKSRPGGQHCPDEYVESTYPEVGSQLNVRRLSVGRGDSRQETVVAVDSSAKYRYNLLIMEHTYEVEGETVTRRQEENINQKGEFMLANCYFNPGIAGPASGYRCDTLFTNDALMSLYRINEDITYIAPENYEVHYEGNPIYLYLGYDIRTDQFDEYQDVFLTYRITCPDTRGEPTDHISYKKLDIDEENFGRELIYLTEVPDVLGVQQNIVTSLFESNLDNIDMRTIRTNPNDDYFIEIKYVGEDGRAVNLVDRASGVIQSISESSRSDPEDSSTVYYEVTIDPEETNREVQLRTETETDSSLFNMRLIRVDSSGEEFPITGFTPRTVEQEDGSSFNLVSPGRCEFKAKLVASESEAEAMSNDYELFENYEVYGEDVISDVEQNNEFVSQIIFGNPNDFSSTDTDRIENRPFGFEIIEPYENQVICADELTKPKYVYVTYNNEDLSTSRESAPQTVLNYTISLRGYSNSYTAENGRGHLLKVSDEETLGRNLDSIELTPSLNNLDEGLYDATLSYTIFESVDGIQFQNGEVDYNNLQQRDSRNIEFKIRIGNCE